MVTGAVKREFFCATFNRRYEALHWKTPEQKKPFVLLTALRDSDLRQTTRTAYWLVYLHLQREL